MRIEPGIGGQQRGVDIEHASLPAPDEAGRQDAHVPRQHDILRAGIARRPFHGRIVVFAGHARVRQREGWDSFGPGQRKRGGGGIVGCDKCDFIGRTGQAAGIKQCRHIGARARHEHGDLGGGRRVLRQDAPPTSPRARPRCRPCRARCIPCRPPRCGPQPARFRPRPRDGCERFRHWRARPRAPSLPRN